jgi:hypothetical protein
MTPVVKVVTLIVGTGLVTTLILPGRLTAQVIDALRKLFSGSLATAMGQARAAAV